MKIFGFAIALAALAVVSISTFRAVEWTKHDPKTRNDFTKVVVYASSSFVNKYGPAEELKVLFEPQCQCRLEFVDVGGGNMLLQRLQLQPATRVDVVLGLDLLMLKQADDMHVWKNLKFNAPVMDKRVEPYRFATYMAYNWSPVTIIYDQKNKTIADAAEKHNETLSDFLNHIPNKSLAIPDPRLSSLGQQFLFWSFSETGGWSELITIAKNKIHSLSSGWSQSYGLFTNGQAQSALSYVTSLVYHQDEEKDFSKKALSLKSGHPIQVEYGAVSSKCVTCDFGQQFLAFLISEPAQKILMKKNYMYPVMSGAIAGTTYEKLPDVKVAGRESMDDFTTKWNVLLDQWNALW
jgi:thiamine transport system substrate-binding protein